MLDFLNLKRVNTRGIRQANKHVMMAALTYNLKKLLKWTSKKLNAQVNALEQPIAKIAVQHFLNSITSLIATLQYLYSITTSKNTVF